MAATLGVITPSIIIITIIAAFITNFADLPIVIHAFNGIRVCVCVLILNAVLKLSKSSVKDKWTLLIFLLVFALSTFFDVAATILIVAAGFLGYLIKRFVQKEGN